MKLYIRLVDGNPFEHPMFEDNFKEAFPHIDVNNLPPEFAEFVRVPHRPLDRFEVYEGVTYEKIDGVFTDVHHIRPMTEQEKLAYIESLKASPPWENAVWADDILDWLPPPPKGFVYNARLKRFVPPFSPPKPWLDNARYSWNFEKENWDVIIQDGEVNG